MVDEVRLLLSGIAILGAMTLMVDTSHAEDADISAQIEIVLAGTSSHIVQAEQHLSDVFQSQGVPATFVIVPNFDPNAVISNRIIDESTLARVWIDFRRQDQIVLFLVDRSWEQALVRLVTLTEGLDVIALEEVGQIVSAAVEALIAGQPLEMTPDEAASLLQNVNPVEEGSAPSEIVQPTQTTSETTMEVERQETAGLSPPAASFPEARPLSLEIGAFYGLALWSGDETPIHGPKLGFLIGFDRARLRPGLAFSIDYRVPNMIEQGDIEVSIQRLRLQLEFQIRLFSRRFVDIRLSLGGGVDFSFVAPVLLDEREDLTALPNVVVTVPIVQCAFILNIKLTSTWFITLEVGINIDVKDLRYVIRYEEESEIFFDPWRILPLFSLGITADVL